MEKSFAQIRKELNDLGYTETLRPECLPLTRRLLGDLKITTESLRKYMKISQQALEERDSLQLGAEPYKCDNAKLIKECNELHLAFIQFKEQHEKVQRDLRTKIISLENQLTDCAFEKQKLLSKLKELQSDLNCPHKKGHQYKSQVQTPTLKSKQVDKSRQFELSTAMASADSRIAYLSQEIKKLKDEQLHLLKNNEFLNSQLDNRNEEIKRLNALLEGGRPTKAISKDCCYKNIDNKMGSLQDEINKLRRENNTLQNQVTEALARQHEAMKRALNLAERNKLLEDEMKDIDQIALSVEAECNNTVKSNIEKVTKLQDKMNESVITMQTLEREVTKLKLDKTELISEIEAIKLEKRNLQLILETEAEDKKRLTDRLNNFTVIEQSLNMEIDRLLRLSGEQKRKIAELESEVMASKVRTSSIDQRPVLMRSSQDSENIIKKQKSGGTESTDFKKTSSTKVHKKTCKKAISATTKLNSLSKQTSNQVNLEQDKTTSIGLQYDPQMGLKCCCEAGGCIKWMRELLEKDMTLRQEQATQQIESLRNEKEFYLKEYHRLMDQHKSTPLSEKSTKEVELLTNKVKEKDVIIASLQDNLRTLSSEKYALSSRLEAQSREMSAIEGDDLCAKTGCKRKSRELDVHREEVKHLERENSALKNKIQALNESSVFNEERMKRAFHEMEEHITKLENERRDLVISQGSNRSNITHLEDECQILREKLKLTQNDAISHKANYDQLKILHDQSNRALSDAQSQLLRAETECQGLQSKMSLTNRESTNYERDIARLQGDIEVMKSQLTKIDKEKDELLNAVDDKTEQIDRLENQLKEKRNQISALEIENKDIKRRMGKVNDESSSYESQLRSIKQELNMLQQDLDNERRLKEAAIQENRRLQDDLASATLDCRDARKELEIAKRQVEDLKRQLQHYVAEVKRTEDLISQKELERAEVLDQFKSLSQENNVLESTNHTLENEASQSRVQLSVALDHATDLERKLENQESIIRSYEKQISELTSQVASLEIQMKQGSSMTDRVSTELKQLKDLCVRLDAEKDDLKRSLRNKEEEKMSTERQIDLLSRENKDLKRALEKDQDNQDGLERLLNEARQEVIEQRLLNEDLQSEITKTRTKVEELQVRLKNSPETVPANNIQDKIRKPPPVISTSEASAGNVIYLDNSSILESLRTFQETINISDIYKELPQSKYSNKTKNFNENKNISDIQQPHTSQNEHSNRVLVSEYREAYTDPNRNEEYEFPVRKNASANLVSENIPDDYNRPSSSKNRFFDNQKCSPCSQRNKEHYHCTQSKSEHYIESGRSLSKILEKSKTSFDPNSSNERDLLTQRIKPKPVIAKVLSNRNNEYNQFSTKQISNVLEPAKSKNTYFHNTQTSKSSTTKAASSKDKDSHEESLKATENISKKFSSKSSRLSFPRRSMSKEQNTEKSQMFSRDICDSDKDEKERPTGKVAGENQDAGEEKKDLEKESVDGAQALFLTEEVCLNVDVEPAQKNIGVSTDPMKLNFGSCHEDRCPYRETLHEIRELKNKENIQNEQVKSANCKCQCHCLEYKNFKEKNLNASTCCCCCYAKCPLNINFHNIFYEKQSSNTTV